MVLRLDMKQDNNQDMKKGIDLDGKRDHLLPQRYMYKRLID